MKTKTNQVLDLLSVTEDTTFHNVSAREIIVHENVTARFFGTIDQKLHVKSNAIVYLHGDCNGQIVNEGGVIYQFLPNGEAKCLENEPFKSPESSS